MWSVLSMLALNHVYLFTIISSHRFFAYFFFVFYVHMYLIIVVSSLYCRFLTPVNPLIFIFSLHEGDVGSDREIKLGLYNIYIIYIYIIYRYYTLKIRRRAIITHYLCCIYISIYIYIFI